MYVGTYPPIRDSRVIRKYFNGKVHLLKIKKVLVKKGNIWTVDKEVEEMVVGG